MKVKGEENSMDYRAFFNQVSVIVSPRAHGVCLFPSVVSGARSVVRRFWRSGALAYRLGVSGSVHVDTGRPDYQRRDSRDRIGEERFRSGAIVSASYATVSQPYCRTVVASPPVEGQ